MIKEAFEKLRREIDEYLNRYYREESFSQGAGTEEAGAPAAGEAVKGGHVYGNKPPQGLDELLQEVGESFHEMLFRKIQESGKTDVEIYKGANMDRKLFSKIRSNPAYHPKKTTILALAISLHLDLEDTIDLLSRAEYALSPGNKVDLIIKYFIERSIYDVDTINYMLYAYGQPVLGE